MAKKWTAALLAVVMILTSFPFVTMASGSSEATKPKNGTTGNRPFVSGTPSENYRIPGMVTLDDGTIVAVADARWDKQQDGGGNDVITARSTDNGNTWSYTMAGYYGDNGNAFNKSSTGYCDSNITTDGETVYLLSTFFASGVAINNSSGNDFPESGSGLNSNGQLLLRESSSSSYNYHVGDFDSDGYAPVLDSSNNATGYQVNGEYELCQNGSRIGCVWYSDCKFQALKTQYLFFRKSLDGGQTWSRITLVNVKSSDEMFVGAGPGRGIVLEDGTICLPVYKWERHNYVVTYTYTQASSFIYSRDGGQTWSRTNDILSGSNSGSNWSSESQLVDLGNGTIRSFFRNGKDQICYADATLSGSTYSFNGYQTTGITNCSDCMISAIMYPYNINGKRAILVSCPSDEDSRTTGSIYALLLNSDNSISEYTKKDITASGATFQYSCLTVLSDGRVADLYENGGKDFAFKIYDVSGLTGGDVEAPVTTVLRMNVGQKKTVNFTDSSITSTDTGVAAVSDIKELPGATANRGSDSSFSGENVSVKRALYTFTKTGEEYTIAHAGMYLSVGTNGKAGYPGASTPANVTLVAVDGGGFQLKQDGHYGLYFDTANNHFERWDFTGKGKDDQDEATVLAHTTFQLYRRVRDGETGSTELPGYICVNTVDDGEEYLIVYPSGGSYYLLNPSTSTTDMYAHCLKANGGSTTDGYSATITAKATGSCAVTGGLNTYQVTVADGESAVTGVVTYDPVIYTHGSATSTGQDYMYCGSTIADGSQAGENETKYTINDSRYKILSIECKEDPSASINCTNGKLTGTLNKAETTDYISYAKGETVTLETTLEDADGNIWTQTDKLYVASNPVAGHSVGAQNLWNGTTTTASAALGAIYVAENSYGNTDRKVTADTCKIENAYNIEDANALVYQDEYTSGGDTARGHLFSTSTGDKIVGLSDTWKKNNPTERRLEVKDSGSVSAYYYYDMSSDQNMGITRNNAQGTSYSFNLAYVPMKTQGSRGDSGTVSFPNADNLNYVSGTGFSADKTYFSSYTMGSGPKQYQTISGTATVAPNSTEDQSVITETQSNIADTNTWGLITHSVNNYVNLGLTLQVKVCNKSNERTPYNEAVSKVRVSTDYTKETWDKYTTALLNTEAYLNNYTLLTTDASTATVGTDLDEAYTNLTKRADFTELEAAVEQTQSAYDKGFEGNVTGDQNIYTVESWENFASAYEAGAQLLEDYPENSRANTAGYTVGPDSDTKTLQTEIDTATETLKNAGLVAAADASAYESARSLSGTIDRTAYEDKGEAITTTVTNGNSTIYKAYNGKDYVNVPATDQGTVDGYTTDLLTRMNVDTDSQSGRTFTVTCKVDGTDFATREQKTKYYYGTVAHIDLSAYSGTNTVCLVTSGTGIDVTETKIDLADCNYQLSLLVQQDITVTVTTATEPNVLVEDYFGTILAAFTNASSVTVSGTTVTVDGTQVEMKPSPKYTFTGWSKANGTYTVASGQVMTLIQKGTRNAGVATYTIGVGTASDALINDATTLDTTGLSTPMELTSANGEFWTRTVNGVEMLASYEQNFTLFSNGVDTQFRAYASSSDLPSQLQDQAMSGTPVTYGVGYFANDKFTLACDFSAGSQVTVLEVGAIYSATKSGEDELVKGGDGTVTVVSRNIGHWNDNNENSGTYTMTKKDSATGTHYMRSYVSYRVERQGTQVPFVVYGDVYQCVDGSVSAVNN